MAKKSRNAVLLVKIQPVAGTDAAPTGAANAIMAMNISAQPVTAEFAKRNNIKPYLGNMGSVPVAIHAEINFEVEMAGAGAAGTAPKYGPLLRACAFSETITAGTSAVYAPVSNAMEFATIYYNLDGILYKMTDAKGTVSFELNAKGIPVMKFKFIGMYSTPTDTALPTGVDYSGFKDPVAVNKDNTPTASLHGVAGKVQSISVDMANQLVYRNLIGTESIEIPDRQPTGSFVMELDSVAAKDWYTTIKAGTLGPLSVVHGRTAGNIVELAAPKVQVLDPSFSDSDGIVMLTTKLEIQPNTGNDEFVLTVR
ncbi:phage tail tube protein [Pseudoduganella sp. HUAS MS19]